MLNSKFQTHLICQDGLELENLRSQVERAPSLIVVHKRQNRV